MKNGYPEVGRLKEKIIMQNYWSGFSFQVAVFSVPELDLTLRLHSKDGSARDGEGRAMSHAWRHADQETPGHKKSNWDENDIHIRIPRRAREGSEKSPIGRDGLEY